MDVKLAESGPDMEFEVIAQNLEKKVRTQDVLLDQEASFESLLLNHKVLRGLQSSGFRKPSPIQLKAIPLGRCGFDLVIRAKAGTGKTLVFGTIALEVVDVANQNLQVLIIVPAREIAEQIVSVLRTVGKFIEGLNVASFIGGMPLDVDIEKTKACHIAVGTPGRLRHLITDYHLETSFVRLFVLDEADKLMENAFVNDINEIYNSLSQRKQMIAASATYPKDLDLFLTNYMLSPTQVSAEIDTPVLLGLRQFASIDRAGLSPALQMKTKNETLLKILMNVSFTQCLVFSNYQTRAESTSNMLNGKGWHSEFISAAQSQTKRLEAINNLKDCKNRILLSTDVAARGIDAPNVDLVINYDLPNDAVTYLHRMGRAGRYGSSGICISLLTTSEELKQLKEILGAIGCSISKLPPITESSVNLSNIDLSSLEQVHGTKPSMDDTRKVATEVMELNYKLKQKYHWKEKLSKPKSVESLQGLTPEQVVVMMEDKKKGEDVLPSKLAEANASTLFQTLILPSEKEHPTSNGKQQKGGSTVDLSASTTRSPDENINNNEDAAIALFHSLLFPTDAKAEDPKKRKIGTKQEPSSSSVSPKNPQSLQKNSLNNIYSKNVALMNVAKILEGSRIAEDSASTVGDLLSLVKAEDSCTDSNFLDGNPEETFEAIVKQDLEIGQSLKSKIVAEKTKNQLGETKDWRENFTSHISSKCPRQWKVEHEMAALSHNPNIKWVPVDSKTAEETYTFCPPVDLNNVKHENIESDMTNHTYYPYAEYEGDIAVTDMKIEDEEISHSHYPNLEWVPVKSIKTEKNAGERPNYNKLKTETSPELERVVDTSFSYAMETTEQHWLQSLPQEDVQRYEEHLAKKTLSQEEEKDSGEDEYYEEEYYEADEEYYEEEEENHEEEGAMSTTDDCSTLPNLQWVPVESNIQSQAVDKKPITEVSPQLENVFQSAFSYAADATDKHWLESLPQDEVKRFQDHVDYTKNKAAASDDAVDEEEEYCEEDGDYSEVNQEDNCRHANYNQERDALQNVPQMPIYNRAQPFSDRVLSFVQYYEMASQNMWQALTTFQSVEDSHNYSYYWEQQLDGITDYVQRNFFVEEMHTYQQNYGG